MLVWTQNDGCSRTGYYDRRDTPFIKSLMLEQGPHCNISYTVPNAKGLRFILHLRTFSPMAIVCDKIKKEI